jgi:hypothetical protein
LSGDVIILFIKGTTGNKYLDFIIVWHNQDF